MIHSMSQVQTASGIWSLKSSLSLKLYRLPLVQICPVSICENDKPRGPTSVGAAASGATFLDTHLSTTRYDSRREPQVHREWRRMPDIGSVPGGISR